MMRRMKSMIVCLVLFSALESYSQSSQKKYIWLSDLDLLKMTCVMGTPKINQSITGDAMSVGGEKLEHGVGTHAYSRMLIDLNGKAISFSAKVGLDDGAYIHSSISFYVLGDKEILWESGVVKKGEKPRSINVDLTGVKKLGLLAVVNREDISENYADWGDAKIAYIGEEPVALDNNITAKQFGILTPPAPLKPRLNSPEVYGVSPGSPILYRIPATGERPINFRVEKLPAGLKIDKASGIITGKITRAGKYQMTLVATNRYSETKKPFTIIAGNGLVLTPPMGWNSWYIYYSRVSDSVMRLSADQMVRSSMADFGYQYVNIDDCWMNKIASKNEEEVGLLRNEGGMLRGNKRFPDMNELTNYIHSKGLKAGIYSSPGPKTCAGYAGSYQHEILDANTFANWGFDFLKYDWCSYGSVANNNSLQKLKAPFLLMGDALKKTGRDIVFNICQYGMGDVWKWGSEAGHSWRTGPDLGTATGSFIPGFYNTAINNAEYWQYAHPSAWNDPDYITIGWVGSSNPNGQGRKTSFTPNEQYAYMSLWALMASPLFYSGDMSKLDSFTVNVLCNHEVIAVDQDLAGKQGKVIRNDSTGMLMLKELSNKAKAVGLFNFPGNKRTPADYFVWDNKSDGTKKIRITSSELGVSGKFHVRNLWTQKDLGIFEKYFEADVPYHGVVFLKISQK